MAIAGKVAPTFKGDYDATVTYQFYDVVRHNNSLWMSKKSNTLGIEPTAENAEYWFLAIDGSFTDASTLDGHDSEYFATAQSVTDLTNGTTPAGDSNKLGGKGASEYMLTGGEYLTTSIKEKALAVPIGTYFYHLGGASYTGGDLPNNDNSWAYGSAMVMKRGTSSLEIVMFAEATPRIAMTTYNGVTWKDWAIEVVQADLANYLPKSGGTVGDGSYHTPMNIKGDAVYSFIKFINNSDEKNGFIGFNGKDNPVFMNAEENLIRDILHSGNVGNYALPRTGGAITGDADTLLTLDTSTPNSFVRFAKSGNTQGYIGFIGDVATVKNGSSDWATLLHTGNKPSGSYTGNGSEESRSINTGGIGSLVYITNNYNLNSVIIGLNGGILWNFDGNGVNGVASGIAYFVDGVLVMKTTTESLNASGVTYTYQVL